MSEPTVQPSAWWKSVVVYQVYPRSFKDSNGDGLGDLNGVTEQLDYLKLLGVDVVWLSPHFDSPNADNGYDIRDYRKVMAEFGTMADFDRLLDGLTARGIRLIIDLVVNHTSDEHAWFQASRSSRDDPHRDYYLWRDPSPQGGPPNNYPSFFGGSAWELDDASGQYYLHYFDRKQPDLNWAHQAVQDEVFGIMRFWLDKGVAGFRMDVIPLISKPAGLPDLTPEQLQHPEYVYADGPHLHEYLQRMHREVLAPSGAMSVGEALGTTFAQSPLFTDEGRGELSMIFHFDAVRIGRDNWRQTPWTLPALKAAYTQVDRAAGTDGWATSFLSNHDNPRPVSRFGDDSPRWRAQSAKALATLVLTQRATPFLYQGDELGMTNYPFTRVEEFDDVEVRGQWRGLVETGQVPAEEYLHHLRQTSRDHARTPMQWSVGAQGGFTAGRPWLAVNPNFVEINAEAQLSDPDSVFHFHRRLITLRRDHPALVFGAFQDVAPLHERVFAYTRTLEGVRLLVVILFGSEPLEYALPQGLVVVERLLGNTGERVTPGAAHLSLTGWHAGIYRLES